MRTRKRTMNHAMTSPLAMIPFLLGIDASKLQAISGRVEETGGLHGVKGALVTLRPESASGSTVLLNLTTNDQGEFNFEEVPDGTYYLMVQYRSFFIEGPKVNVPNFEDLDYTISVPIEVPDRGDILTTLKKMPLAEQYHHNFDFLKISATGCTSDTLPGNCYNFSSPDDAFSYPVEMLDHNNGDFSIALWVMFRAPKTVGLLSRGSEGNGFDLTIAEQEIAFRIQWNGNPLIALEWKAEQHLNDSRCHLIVLTVSRTSGDVQLFVDEDPTPKAFGNGRLGKEIGVGPLWIGKGWHHGFQPGFIADPRILPRIAHAQN